MKTIIKSLMTISLVAALAIGGTMAYFSDVEKSTGNTFKAGIFDLTIDSDCHFNGAGCICTAAGDCYWDKKGYGETEFDGKFGDGEMVSGNECSCVWDAKDLTNEKFFSLANLIPGDQGEATISMHVSGDAYYVRSKIDGAENYDNGCNKQECADEGGTWNSTTKKCTGATCGVPGSDESGELDENMDFAIWADMGTTEYYQCPAGEPGCTEDPEEGDNVMNSIFEYDSFYLAGFGGVISGDDLAGGWTYLQDPLTLEHQSFRDGATYYLGMAWCVGEMTVASAPDGAGVYAITCNGKNVNNIIQSDSYSYDMTFGVMQATHNDETDPWGIGAGNY